MKYFFFVFKSTEEKTFYRIYIKCLFKVKERPFLLKQMVIFDFALVIKSHRSENRKCLQTRLKTNCLNSTRC